MVIALSFQLGIQASSATCLLARILTGSLACPMAHPCDSAPNGTGGGAMPALTGKVAIVTGASRGIGEAAAIALAEAGAAVMLAARSGAQADANAKRITSAGGKAFALECDVSDYAACQRVVSETAK